MKRSIELATARGVGLRMAGLVTCVYNGRMATPKETPNWREQEHDHAPRT